MIKLIDKFKIIRSDILHIVKYRIGSVKDKKILWGRSPYLKYGPGIRTLRIKKYLDNELFEKNLVYIQSHWPWYEIILYTLTAKLFRIKIIFNQNGIYYKDYKSNFVFLNNILLFGILLSDHVIYQSNFCHESISKISINPIKKILKHKKHSILLNPTIEKRTSNVFLESNQHTILICNSFSKDRLYYSKYIYNLILKIYKNKRVDRIVIIGNFLNNLKLIEINNLYKVKKLKIIKEINNSEVLNLISQCTFIVHLNYGDPCPNFISEAISHNKPTILNEVGGAREIALDSCIIPKNNIIYYGYKMPAIKDSIISINQMIYNYDQYKKATEIRKNELNINNYISSHKEIIKDL